MENTSKYENFKKISNQKNVDLINKRKIINGEDDGLMQVSPLKHPFAHDIFQTMLKNTWMPQEVPMGADKVMWDNPDQLTEQERKIFKKSLAFVSNLDGIQTNNLTHNILRQITSPEVALAITRQAYEEALHVHSYSTMIEALGLDPEEIYGMYRQDMTLYEKNKYVLQSLGKIAPSSFKTGTFENDQLFLEACVSNIILEGIYFYSAFMTFYILHKNGKMINSTEMIKFINRDEDIHLQLFIHIVNTIKKEQPELWTEEFQQKCIKNIEGAVEQEVSWGVSCIEDGIHFLNAENLREYIQFVADMRLNQIGLPKKYNSENPFPWIDDYTQGASLETNFFEGTVTEYSTGSLNWD